MWQKKEHNVGLEEIFLERGLHKLVARLLSQRNVSPEELDVFLSAEYKNISAPHTLKGTKEAALIFCTAIKSKKSIAVIGDYDADGVVSSVMIQTLCRALNYDCKVFIPSRLEHGYGLNPKTLAAFKEFVQDPPDLLMVLDSGSNNDKEIRELKDFGVKQIIIIDHHIYDPEKISKSADVLINWRLCDCHEMCTCGEVYQFIRAIRKLTTRINPIEFLSYAAIGTLADVTPVVGDNRIIVKNGLLPSTLNSIVASGLNSLLRHSKLLPAHLVQEDVLFKVAPKINAVGRLFDPRAVFTLLMEQNHDLADKMAESVDEYNTKRKQIQKQIEEEAKTIASNKNFEHGILLHKNDWHIGVVGIVASKVLETYHKPTIIVGQHNGILKGSGRSLPGINLAEVLNGCSDVFEEYGGHDLAVGVTLKNDCADVAGEAFNEACREYYETHSFELSEIKYYDAELKPSSVNVKTADLIKDALYPYCPQNNPDPVFRLSNVVVSTADVREGEHWRLLKFEVEGVDFTFAWFTMNYGSELQGRTVDVYFKFPQKWGRYSQLNVTDIVVKE